MDVVVKKFNKFAVFFIFLSVSQESVGVYGGGETAGPGGEAQVAGPDWGGGGEVGRDGRRGDHLHHLDRQPGDWEGGGPGDVPGAEWHHCQEEEHCIAPSHSLGKYSC